MLNLKPYKSVVLGNTICIDAHKLLSNSKPIKESLCVLADRCHLTLMHLYRTSPNFLYMCRFKYIFSTFLLPLIPICSLTDGFLSASSIFWARTRDRSWTSHGMKKSCYVVPNNFLCVHTHNALYFTVEVFFFFFVLEYNYRSAFSKKKTIN